MRSTTLTLLIALGLIGAPREYIYALIRETPGFNHIKAGRHLPDFVPPVRKRARPAKRRR